MSKKFSIKIIYEDELLIIADKPTGILTVPAHPENKNNLTFFMNERLKQKGAMIKAHPCHRLDKETSGLIIFAKGKKIQKIIMEQFQKHKVRKTYIAFIQGHLKKKSGELKTYIQGAWPYNLREEKKLAITKFQEICGGKTFSVLKLEPLTGRTNQIRIQFRDIGHPLLGERRFAFARDWLLKFRRVALHACFLQFTHPVSGEVFSCKSNLPDDMLCFLQNNNLDIEDDICLMA